MKYFAFALLAIWIHLAASYNGSECRRGRRCYEKRGYIQHKSSAETSRWNQWRIEADVPTTIVIDFTTMMGFDIGSVEIHVDSRLGYSLHKVDGRSKRIFAFERSYSVRIVHIATNNMQRFDVNYYVGCQIMEEQDIKIVKKAEQRPTAMYNNLYMQWGNSYGLAPHSPTCWLVIPTIKKESTINELYDQVITAAYWLHPVMSNFLNRLQSITSASTPSRSPQSISILLNDVFIPEGSYLTLTNLLTGENLQNITEDISADAMLIYKFDRSARYNDKAISSAFLLDLHCNSLTSCKNSNFNFNARAFNDEEHDCMEKEVGCLLGYASCGNTSSSIVPNHQASKSSSNTCEDVSVTLAGILNNLLSAEEEETERRLVVTGSASQQARIRHLNNQCTEDNKYCNKRKYKNCRPFGRTCKIMCYLKRKFGYCNSLTSIFA